MKVITEDVLRRLLRSKELQDGMTWALEGEHFITPSAASFLREHHITVNKPSGKTVRSQKPDFECKQNAESFFKQRREQLKQRTLETELQQLENLLFFPQLPESALHEEWWLYFDLQRNQLAGYRKSRAFPEGLTEKPQHPLTIPREVQRQWQFSWQEVVIQLQRVLNLLSDNAFRTVRSPFYLWMEDLMYLETTINSKGDGTLGSTC